MNIVYSELSYLFVPIKNNRFLSVKHFVAGIPLLLQPASFGVVLDLVPASTSAVHETEHIRLTFHVHDYGVFLYYCPDRKWHSGSLILLMYMAVTAYVSKGKEATMK